MVIFALGRTNRKAAKFLYVCPVRGPDLACAKIRPSSQIILTPSNPSVDVQAFQLADAVTIACVEHDAEVPENHLSLCGLGTQDSLAAKRLRHKRRGSFCCHRFLEHRFNENAHLTSSPKCTYFNSPQFAARASTALNCLLIIDVSSTYKHPHGS